MQNSRFIIKKIERSDIDNVVVIHCASFQNFFLTLLGESFLKVYYNAFRKNKKAIMLGFFENGNLIGFCAATEKSAGFNSDLIISNFMLFALQGIKLFFTNIGALVRLYYNSKKTNLEVKNEGQYAELFSIAVSPLKQNLGVGKLLLVEIESELRLRKCKEIALTKEKCID